MSFLSWIRMLVLAKYSGGFFGNSKGVAGFFCLSFLVVSLISLIQGCFLLDGIRTKRVNISSLNSVVHAHPSDPEVYNVRGVVHGMNGDFEKSLQDFQSALDLNPSYYKAYVNRALVEYKMGNIPMAIKDYDAALKINPNYDIAYIGRGNVYRDEKYGNSQKAFDDFDRAIQLKTSDGRAWFGRALVYQLRKEHQKAIEDFSRAISLSAITPADYYNGRGVSYLAVKNYDSALEDFKLAIHSDFKKATFWFNKGVAHEMQGFYKDSLASYQEALLIDSKYYKAKDGILRVKGLFNPD
ncbi:MAG: tetratricopeptide repeat protein [Candidatus Liberibacter solanacearum]|nr:tetratricopeptide repeat protein [Candidatus Liberibacter solanacearum]